MTERGLPLASCCWFRGWQCLASIRSLLDFDHHCRLAPELIQPVKLALLARKDMKDDVAVVEQTPACLWGPFTAVRITAAVADLLIHDLDERSQLALGRGRANDEIICQDRDRAQVEQHDLLGLVLIYQIDDSMR